MTKALAITVSLATAATLCTALWSAAALAEPAWQNGHWAAPTAPQSSGGTVDGADFQIWRDNLGTAHTAADDGAKPSRGGNSEAVAQHFFSFAGNTFNQPDAGAFAPR
jgi:hypothetical protein